MNRLMRIYRGETNIDFIGKRKLWFALSTAVVLICLGFIALRTAPSSCAPPLPKFFQGLSCGIEFKGGISIQAPIEDGSELADLNDLDVISAVRDELQPLGG